MVAQSDGTACMRSHRTSTPYPMRDTPPRQWKEAEIDRFHGSFHVERVGTGDRD